MIYKESYVAYDVDMQSHKPTDGMKLGLPGATFKLCMKQLE